ncbi:MAG: hypothetical protein ACO34E_09375, partial [Limisphaerales bacterium]
TRKAGTPNQWVLADAAPPPLRSGGPAGLTVRQNLRHAGETLRLSFGSVQVWCVHEHDGGADCG